MSDSAGRHRKRQRSARQAIKGRIHRLVNHQRRVRDPIEPEPSSSHPLQSNGDYHLPSSFSDLGDDKHWLRIGPLMMTILIVGAAWILVLAYFVSRIPEK
jgi:hypothetical protein